MSSKIAVSVILLDIFIYFLCTYPNELLKTRAESYRIV